MNLGWHIEIYDASTDHLITIDANAATLAGAFELIESSGYIHLAVGDQLRVSVGQPTPLRGPEIVSVLTQPFLYSWLIKQ